MKPAFTRRWQNIRCFATVVRSPEAVRHAFAGHPLLAGWWHLILAIHGKSKPQDIPIHSWCTCIADGFRFYGWLYRALAIVFGTAAVVLWHAGTLDLFWMAFLPISGLFLWTISGLAISGAEEYGDTNGKNIWQLVAFLFFITLFLAVTVMAISAQARVAQYLPDLANIGITLAVLAFGIGSYLIELAALVTNKPRLK